jgi:hypothetical protein
MDDHARIARFMRINEIAGAAILGFVGLTAALIVLGALPWDGRAAANLVFGLVLSALMFLTARSAKQDLEDPAGIERRFLSGSMAWSAVLLGAGLVAVIGIIVWGLST